MSMANRIKKLEKQNQGGSVCPVCGDNGEPITECQIVEHAEGPENCPGCGRLLRFTLKFERPFGELGSEI